MSELSDEGIDYDFIRIGEEYEDSEVHTYLKFSLTRSIEIWC